MNTTTSLAINREASNYPQQLLDLHDPPKTIYVSGDAAAINQQPLIAIVGARAASRQGLLDASFLAQGLAQRGYGVVSGLALGVDGAAHRGALAVNGFTLAVGATGLDVVYPPQHGQLAQEIALNGLLLSEFPPGIGPKAFHFPRRNRLIAALCLGVVVVEAAAKSGSLITAHLAADLGREVFALPGSIHSTLAMGCHRLIQTGAKLVTCIGDIVDELPHYQQQHSLLPLAQTQLKADLLTKSVVLSALPLLRWVNYHPSSIDEICLLSGISTQEALVQALLLEAKGLIERLPGERLRLLQK
ncbi:MAG: DNA-processing protein DprA [Burkholderiales bacterium]|nr:DNA-processing protein DprA [Burkholderiales bacterium]